MKAMRILEPRVLAVQEVPTAPRRAGEVRIRIERVGICGSDLGIINGYAFSTYPLTPGHEFAGRVVESDPDSQFHPGDLVTALPILTCGHCLGCRAEQANHCVDLKVLGVHCDGAYAEEIVLPETIVKQAYGLTAEQAAMVEPTAVAVHINRRADVLPGQTVVVIGAGVIGSLIFQVARIRGASKIVAIDRVEQRLELARLLGADWAVNSATTDPVAFVREHLGAGVDVVFDLVTIRDTVEQSIQMARPGGAVTLIAAPHGNVDRAFPINYQEVFRKELRLIGTRLYNDDDFDEALRLVGNGQLRAERLITHRFPLDESPQAVDLLRTQPDVAFKVMLEMD
jgi:2-desacetyl-2-hydroxyethyl bacteriochlorophyllide A dehydrogenase